MGKVFWCKDDIIQVTDPFDDSIIYEFENDEMKFYRFEEWKTFRENEYYDGTPPPDFVTTIETEE